MGASRTKNSIRNIISGFVNKFIVLIFSFVLRTIIIQKLGSEYLGINSLFISILQVLNLTEMGFSSAIVFSLYKPIAENDSKKICALMNVYKKVYRIIGTIVLILGLMVLPFLDKLIKSDCPTDINIYYIYFIQLFNTVITYYLFAYKTALVIAHQRSDISTNINSFSLLLQYILQILVLYIYRNYYMFVIVVTITTILNNLLIGYIATKKYPQYICEGNIDLETQNDIKKRVKGLIINKVCQTTRNSLDSIFLSAFLGLNVVAIYNNYYSILNAVVVMLGIMSKAIISSIGNSIVVEKNEKNYKDMQKFNYIYMCIAGVATICLLCLYQPFMRLWMGEKYMFTFDIVILFCIYFYSLQMGVIRAAYSDAVGLWWENRYRAIAETICNLLLNLLLCQYFGVHGVIIGTLISLLIINFGFGSQILYKHYFKEQKVTEYFCNHFIYALITLFVAIVTYKICSLIMLNGILELLVKASICIVIPVILYILIYCKTNIFKEAKSFVVKILKVR